jgi:hypothetical protein
MFKYHIENLKNLDMLTIEQLDKLVMKTFPNSLTLEQIKQQYVDVPFSVFFVKSGGSIVFLSLIFSSRPTLYFYYICVPKEYRQTGIFKRAMTYIKPKYSQQGYTRFALDASEEKNSHMNQKKRIDIFMHMGFKISNRKNPSPFQQHADPRTYLLTTLGKAELLEQLSEQYIVLLNGEKRTITLKQIKGCVSDLMSDTPDLCPMIMNIAPRTRRLGI